MPLRLSILYTENTRNIALRILGVGLSSLGSIWVARVLGPEKLGISSLVFSLSALVVVLATLNQDNNLVRINLSIDDLQEKDSFCLRVVALRFFISLFLILICFLALPFLGIGSVWLLPIAAGSLLSIFSSNDFGWLYQSRNLMPQFLQIQSFKAIAIGLISILIIRHNWPAGSELAVAAVVSIFIFIICFKQIFPSYEFTTLFKISNNLRISTYLKGGRWLALLGLATYIISYIEFPIIAYFSGVSSLGIFKASHQLANIFNPFLPLFFYKLYPQLVQLNEQKLYSSMPILLNKSIFKLFFVAFPVLMIAYFLSPPFYFYLFGSEYIGASTPFLFLLASKFIIISVKIYSWALLALRRDKELVVASLIISLLSIILQVYFVSFMGIAGASIATLITQLFIFLSLYFLSIKVIRSI
ncbi:polysaccharide biosynthesis C-terminal domain-containing protein [bacterium]|nr:polysaccharide biosynthesis C-terminal domain-containing protein [bacterium]